MIKTLTAIYDGEALRPEDPLDLKPNVRYLVTVEHDHYLYGTPKRRDEASS